jgi:hypothetical protein
MTLTKGEKMLEKENQFYNYMHWIKSDNYLQAGKLRFEF